MASVAVELTSVWTRIDNTLSLTNGQTYLIESNNGMALVSDVSGTRDEDAYHTVGSLVPGQPNRIRYKKTAGVELHAKSVAPRGLLTVTEAA